jgi:hypothetical protein
MKEHIIRAILRQDMSVAWKDAELNGEVNVHLNVHQKARQIIEAELGDFLLSDGEAILVAFEKTTEGEFHHVNPQRMDPIDGEQGAFRLQIPTLVHNTPGEWGAYFYIATNYNLYTGEYTYAYSFDVAKFSEHSSFIDDGLTVPTADNMLAFKVDAEKALENATAALDYEKTSSAAINDIKNNVGSIEKRAIENAENIEMLKAFAVEKNDLVLSEIKDSYDVRVTAAGGKVADNSRATLKKVEGNTVRTLNEFDISKMLNQSNIYQSGNNIVTVSTYGHPLGGTVKELFPNVRANVTYTCACTITQDADSTASNGMIVVSGDSTNSRLVNAHSTGKAGDRVYKKKTVVFTEEDLSKYVYVYGLKSGTMTWENLMLVEGDYSNTDMPAFQPYFTGLKNASFKGITSTGRNLIPYPYSDTTKTMNGITFTDNGDGSFVLSGTATGESYLLLATTTLPAGAYYVSDGGNNDHTARFYVSLSDANYFKNSSFTITNSTVVEIRLAIYGNFSGTATFYPMLNFGDTALPFEPYVEDTLELPTAVESGLGITVDFENKKIINCGVDITLTGVELTGDINLDDTNIGNHIGFFMSEDLSFYTLYIIAAITTVGEYMAKGVSTNGFIATKEDSHLIRKAGALWLGQSDNYVYWVGAADYLGLQQNSTKWVNVDGTKRAPTAEETIEVKRQLNAFLLENPVKIRYIANTGTETELDNNATYMTRKDGMETVLGNENREYVNNTLTQEYFEYAGGEEV